MVELELKFCILIGAALPLGTYKNSELHSYTQYVEIIYRKYESIFMEKERGEHRANQDASLLKVCGMNGERERERERR